MDKLNNTIKNSFGIAGLGIGLGIIGEGLNDSNISNAGNTATGFINPMINIGMAGYTIDMLKSIDSKRRNKLI